MSFVLTGNDDAGVGTLDHAVCCYGKVAQSFSIGVVVKKVTVVLSNWNAAFGSCDYNGPIRTVNTGFGSGHL